MSSDVSTMSNFLEDVIDFDLQEIERPIPVSKARSKAVASIVVVRRTFFVLVFLVVASKRLIKNKSIESIDKSMDHYVVEFEQKQLDYIFEESKHLIIER